MAWQCARCMFRTEKIDADDFPLTCSCGAHYPAPDSAGKSAGLGDTIKRLTSALGVKQCGACKRRQRKLNEWFPYRSANK